LEEQRDRSEFNDPKYAAYFPWNLKLTILYLPFGNLKLGKHFNKRPGKIPFPKQ
jgi:hypothetical protein